MAVTRGEQCAMLFGMWACLFPTITLIVYVDMMLEPTWPIWSRTLVASAVAVPLMSLVVMPAMKSLIARFNGMTVQEYDIACCDPERCRRRK